ncbi:MAG: hypothetical protein D6690_17130 [Nitrospirae bacterium]|nr:MAG: hypothetical protein D6690_17130 [Nitrospirota bacterium]
MRSKGNQPPKIHELTIKAKETMRHRQDRPFRYRESNPEEWRHKRKTTVSRSASFLYPSQLPTMECVD